MSACTMILCWSLLYFLWPPVTGPVMGPTSLLSLVRTRWPCTSWRVERSRSQQVTFILLTHCSPSPTSSPRGCLVFTVWGGWNQVAVCILMRSVRPIININSQTLKIPAQIILESSAGCQMWAMVIWKYLVQSRAMSWRSDIKTVMR